MNSFASVRLIGLLKKLAFVYADRLLSRLAFGGLEETFAFSTRWRSELRFSGEEVTSNEFEADLLNLLIHEERR